MIPHLAHPFRLTNGKTAVVDQDSTAEVAQAVWAILSLEPGDRVEDPNLGMESQLFRQGGVDLDELRRVVEEQEPRAQALTEAEWTGLMAQTVKVSV